MCPLVCMKSKLLCVKLSTRLRSSTEDTKENSSVMKKPQEQLQVLLDFCASNKVDVNSVKAVRRFLKENESESWKKCKKFLKYILIISAFCYAFNYYAKELKSKDCWLEQPKQMRYAFRPPENCDFCENVHAVERVSAISPAEFERRYAYTGRPVIVEDATANWTALEQFDYWYFRSVYHQAKRRQKVLDCQFLPYKTGFRNLYEALDMSRDRVLLVNNSRPWYFGWSNCNSETAEIFRKHYGRPYFLPKASENNAIDWFFIGVSGLGAHMHIDNVRLPSWQAQLTGSKKWLLAPPPECYFRCRRIDVIVKTGDIIVLDTNKWYHQTFVQPGAVSLTIGAEYD